MFTQSAIGVLTLYAVPAALIWGLYVGLRARAERRDEAVRREFEEAGLCEPPTLHPKIDHAKCLGCGSCVAACPEHPGHRVLGLIGGKSHLVGPADCIGHGACARACPVGAITLVFGTERRGVELPVVGPDFQTNVPGLYVAGELGGMGLIRNAVEQGKRAVENIAALPGMRDGEGLDLVIVGAGPAGLAASLTAKAKGLRFVTVEQESLGGTIAHYPRGKLVMTTPFSLPGVEKFRRREVPKEELLRFWEEAVRRSGLEIRFGEAVTDVRREGDGLEVATTAGTYRARAVLLAIGRRGTPRKLGVPGEDLPKVVYRLVDPDQYRGLRVLVVGGGDSALEAATSLAVMEGTDVTLSYRKGGFSRAKRANRERAERAAAEGRLRLVLNSIVTEIRPFSVVLEQNGKRMELENDAVIVCAGGVLPTGFLRQIGVEVETKHGTP